LALDGPWPPSGPTRSAATQPAPADHKKSCRFTTSPSQGRPLVDAIRCCAVGARRRSSRGPIVVVGISPSSQSSAENASPRSSPYMLGRGSFGGVSNGAFAVSSQLSFLPPHVLCDRRHLRRLLRKGDPRERRRGTSGTRWMMKSRLFMKLPLHGPAGDTTKSSAWTHWEAVGRLGRGSTAFSGSTSRCFGTGPCRSSNGRRLAGRAQDSQCHM
jgi:hypothetical protein